MCRKTRFALLVVAVLLGLMQAPALWGAEPAAKNAQSSAAVTDAPQSARHVIDLLDQKAVEAEIKSGGVGGITIRLRRVGDGQLDVLIPAGAAFVAEDAKDTPRLSGGKPMLVAVAERRVTLADQVWASVRVPVAALGVPAWAGTEGRVLQMRRSTQSDEVDKLLRCEMFSQAGSEVQQAAVWIVADDADFNYLGGLARGGLLPGTTRAIGPHQVAKAMGLVDDAGIDVTTKAIWGERRRAFPAGDAEPGEWFGRASARNQDARDASLLLEQGLISLTVEGAGIDKVVLSLRRVRAERVVVRIPMGTLFTSADKSVQDMVALAERIVVLDDDSVRVARMQVSCATMRRPVPKSGASLELSRSVSGALARLVLAIEGASVEFPARQAAIWIVTDDANYEDMGSLRKPSPIAPNLPGGMRMITRSDAAEGMRLVEEAGIDITGKAIWSDKDKIGKPHSLPVPPRPSGVPPPPTSRSTGALSRPVEETSAQEALEDRPDPRHLVDLLAQNAVEAEISAASAGQVLIRVRRLAKEAVCMHVPAGVEFPVPDGQPDIRGDGPRLVVTCDRNVVLSDEECVSVRVPVAAVGVPGPQSKEGAALVARKPAGNADLEKLFAAPGMAEASASAQQAAVWMVADDADVSYLSSLVGPAALGGPFRWAGISKTEAARGIRLVDGAGIDVSMRAIWADRAGILASLAGEVHGDVQLKDWLAGLVATRRPDARDLHSLIKEKRIEVEAESGGMQSVVMRLRRLGNERLVVHVPLGTVFASKSKSIAGMLALSERTVILEDDGAVAVRVQVASEAMRAASPKRTDKLVIKSHRETDPLHNLAVAIAQSNADFLARQTAIWIVTDNVGYEELGNIRLTSSRIPGRLIGPPSVAAAVKLVQQAGIDITRKAIWKDRSSFEGTASP